MYRVLEADVLPTRHPRKEFVHILELFGHRHLGLDHIEQQRGRHDGAAVHHRVVRLTVVVQADLVEVPAARLSPDVLLYNLGPKLVQCQGVRERFATNNVLRLIQ